MLKVIRARASNAAESREAMPSEAAGPRLAF